MTVRDIDPQPDQPMGDLPPGGTGQPEQHGPRSPVWPARGIVVVGGALQLQHCSLYDDHLTAILHSHHVCPESWWVKAGLPVASPLLEVCPSCHYDVHAGIDSIIEGRDIAALPVLCQQTAQQAFPIAAANGLTPALTL